MRVCPHCGSPLKTPRPRKAIWHGTYVEHHTIAHFRQRRILAANMRASGCTYTEIAKAFHVCYNRGRQMARRGIRDSAKLVEKTNAQVFECDMLRLLTLDLSGIC